ncbi:hypothetical protein CFBP4215_02018 [Pseudomonas syringae pv. syringae]|nr:hypothetical protein CFBP4215_02018 [Pseudomonas syringae pv. syringae]
MNYLQETMQCLCQLASAGLRGVQSITQAFSALR